MDKMHPLVRTLAVDAALSAHQMRDDVFPGLPTVGHASDRAGLISRSVGEDELAELAF